MLTGARPRSGLRDAKIGFGESPTELERPVRVVVHAVVALRQTVGLDEVHAGDLRRRPPLRPLYRFELGVLLGRWIGESEQERQIWVVQIATERGDERAEILELFGRRSFEPRIALSLHPEDRADLGIGTQPETVEVSG